MAGNLRIANTLFLVGHNGTTVASLALAMLAVMVTMDTILSAENYDVFFYFSAFFQNQIDVRYLSLASDEYMVKRFG